MKVRNLTEQEFVPQRIEIIIENKKELYAFLLKLNMSIHMVQQAYETISNPPYDIKDFDNDASSELWKTCEKIREKFGIEQPYIQKDKK